MAFAKNIWKVVLAITKPIGRFQTWLLLTLFYIVFLAPVAIIFKWCADPLHLRLRKGSNWWPKTEPPDWLTWARTQF